jgi:hypothetical protein
MANYDNFQLLCLRFIGDSGDIRASNIYMSSQSSRQPIIDAYPSININYIEHYPILELVIYADPPPDNDDRFVIVNLDGPQPPDEPSGGGNRIRLLKVTAQELAVLEQNIQPLLIKITDLFQINITAENIKNIIASIKKLSATGGKKRFGKSSSRPRRRSSKKRGTQRKQKRRQRRASRRAY